MSDGSEAEEHTNDLVGQWHEHPVTQKFVKNIRENLEAAKVIFESACRDSTDPKVRGTYALVATLKKTLEDMGS